MFVRDIDTRAQAEELTTDELLALKLTSGAKAKGVCGTIDPKIQVVRVMMRVKVRVMMRVRVRVMMRDRVRIRGQGNQGVRVRWSGSGGQGHGQGQGVRVRGRVRMRVMER